MNMKRHLKKATAYLLTMIMVLTLAVIDKSVNTQAATKKYVKSVSVSKSVTVEKGKKKTMSVKVKVAGKANKKVTVKVKDKKIAKASYNAKKSEITVTGVKKGSTKITVTTKGKNKKGKKITKTVKVKVAESKKPSTPTPTPQTIMVTSVSLSEKEVTLLKGDSRQMLATVFPNNATDKSLSWTSSAASIAVVDNNGLVKAVGEGTATVTATNVFSGKKAACVITVKDEVTVTSQSELDEVLSSAKVGKITIATTSDIMVPSGDYSNTRLEIQTSGGGVITNNAIFQSVTVSSGEYNEKAASNKILITSAASVTIGSNSSVEMIAAFANNSPTDQLEIVNNGTITNLMVSSAATVTVSGNASAATVIPVSINSDNVTLKSEQNIMLKAVAKADIDLTGDTDKTTITVDKKDNLPNISGVGFIPYTITSTNEEGTIAAEALNELEPLDIEGVVKDAYTDKVLSGVDVYLVQYSDYRDGMTFTNNNSVKASTDTNGRYSYKTVKSGNYYMVMEKTGYKKAVQLLTVSSRFNKVYENEAMELLDSSKSDTQNASVLGIVNDASNKSGIAGITVELRKNKGNIIGDVVSRTTTKDDGSYTFDKLEAEQYTLYFKDNRSTEDEHYINLTRNVCVKADTRVSASATMSKPIKGAGIRFVLSWGSEADGVPSDLDSHLFAPTPYGTYTEVDYSNMKYVVGDETYYMLEVDETNYKGPETTLIQKNVAGIYYFYVYNFSHDPEDSDHGYLYSSKAYVDVFSGNELLTRYNVPTTVKENAIWWKVCSYDSNTGAIQSYNELLEDIDLAPQYQGRYIDSVGGSNYITGFTESSNYIYVSVTNMCEWSNVTFNMREGYSAEVIEEKEYDEDEEYTTYKLKITDINNTIVAKKILGFEY